MKAYKINKVTKEIDKSLSFDGFNEFLDYMRYKELADHTTTKRVSKNKVLVEYGNKRHYYEVVF